MKLNASRQAGFTLIEIMVVVVILGVLAAVIVPQVMNRPDQARITRVHADLAAIEGALNTYRLDNFNYPSTEQGLDALVNRPDGQPEARNWAAGGYLPRLPRDPWGNPYQYLNPGVRGEIDIWSFGADGQPGGENMNADIGNWSLDD